MINQAPTQRILRSQIDFAYYNPRRTGNSKAVKADLLIATLRQKIEQGLL